MHSDSLFPWPKLCSYQSESLQPCWVWDISFYISRTGPCLTYTSAAYGAAVTGHRERYVYLFFYRRVPHGSWTHVILWIGTTRVKIDYYEAWVPLTWTMHMGKVWKQWSVCGKCNDPGKKNIWPNKATVYSCLGLVPYLPCDTLGQISWVLYKKRTWLIKSTRNAATCTPGWSSWASLHVPRPLMSGLVISSWCMWPYLVIQILSN